MATNHRNAADIAAFAGAREVRILVYVDTEELMLGELYGPDRLIEALTGGLPVLRFTVCSRTEGDRITSDLLARFDEAWFFVKAVDGDPLDIEEIGALRKWMNDGRGVLVAGDHATRRGRQLRGLGAKVGGLIPRAGDMRRWDEPPSLSDPGDMANSVDYAPASPLLEIEELERDAKPQRLLLLPVDGEQPHPIFRDGDGTHLDRFPDHMHEGEVKSSFDATKGDWAGLGQARPPQLVARGIDWRHGRTFDLMALWDGHAVTSPAGGPHGRIISDSSFHHYVNDNLLGLAALDNQDWPKIRALYRNIAAWLAPPAIKQDHVTRALAWLADHDRVQDAGELGYAATGRLAWRMLAEVLPGAWLHELVDDFVDQHGIPRPEAQFRQEFSPHLLGGIVRGQMRTPRGRKGQDRGRPLATTAPRQAAVSAALEEYGLGLEAKQGELKRLMSALRPARVDSEQ